MKIKLTSRGFNLSLFLVTVFVLTSAFGGQAPAAYAQVEQSQAAGRDPNTPVYNKASIKITADPSAIEAADTNPYEGTGELTADSGVNLKAALGPKAMANLEAVSAPDGQETIIGLDTRVRTYTRSYPARATVLITFRGGRCTGWLYGPDVVATAGHCVHSGGTAGAWMTGVRVWPGYDGTVAPFGSCTARWLASVNGWTVSASELFDYGVIKLNCTVGNTVGWYGFWWQTASLNLLPTIISGYPGDKPFEQWLSVDQVRATQTNQVFYSNDTIGGMSGSPVWQDRPPGSAFCSNGPCVMAIHAYGLHGASPHDAFNHGTRIREPVFNNLITWRNAP
jgi:glutamyl endopeptidase